VSYSKKRIKPAVTGSKIYPPGGGQPIPSSGVSVDWDDERDRPRLAHWSRYLKMRVVKVVEQTPRSAPRPAPSLRDVEVT